MKFSTALCLIPIGAIALLQIYGFIVGLCIIFLGIKSVFASQVFSGQTVMLSFDLERYAPLIIGSPALTRLLIGLGLLFGSLTKGSLWGGLLGGGSIFGGVIGLFGNYTSTAIGLTGFWGGIISIIILLWLGCLTIVTVFPSRYLDK